jgi:DNA-binding NtrC family response regulator
MTKVLLVDDEEAFVATLGKRLRKRGLLCEEAHSGADALSRLESVRGIDVVVLDVKMPEMDGLEALKEVKRLHPIVEVIMLTGHATIESAIEGMKFGAFDYLMKPCDIEDLVAKVGEAAQRKADHEERIMQARLREITERGRG